MAVAGKALGRLREQGKKLGVLVSGRSTNEECYLAVKLARGALGTGHVDAFLRSPYQAFLQGLGETGTAPDLCGALQRLEGSRRILLLEGDLATTHPHVAFSVLRAVRRGARLVTLGMARTQMSQVASVHLPFSLPDPQIPPPGLREALGPPGDGGCGDLSVVMAPFVRDPGILREMARALVETLGNAPEANGPGPCFLPLPHRANTRGALEMGASPGLLPGLAQLADPEAGNRIRSVWERDPCLDEGAEAEAMLHEVQGLVVVREHPPDSAAAPGPALRALERLDCLIVLDAYRSPTSDSATVALPLAALAEEDGTLTSLEGRVQRIRRAVPPPGLARPGWQVLSDLLGGLGISSPHRSPADVFNEIGSVIPAFGRLTPELVDASGGGWVTAAAPINGKGIRSAGGPRRREGGGDPGTHWLALEGSFEWDDDLLVGVSPNLRRDGATAKKLHPHGLVTMHPSDAQTLGVRAGWSVQLRSPLGQASVAVALSPRTEPGVLLVPFGFREAVAPVLGGEGIQRVELERT
jgi:predicted molibdopterin-dependent oxidoreductase YjgC